MAHNLLEIQRQRIMLLIASAMDLITYNLGIMSRTDDILIKVRNALDAETQRQRTTLSLIASESIPWTSVQSVYDNHLARKYAEGYPGVRYYSGCENADTVERIAIERARVLFGASYANVQPLCGSNANLAVYLALLKPGDTIMGMSLKSGGHLTHGSRASLTGKWFKSAMYEVELSGRIDYARVREIARAAKPKIIIAGVSAYPRALKMEEFRSIADEVGAYLLADIAHVAGLVAGGVYPNPVPYADVVTSTTHKTLRGPRGGLVLSRRDDLGDVLDRAVFPGLQGGPFMHTIAAKAVMFAEDYSDYAPRLVENARAMGKGLCAGGLKLVGDYDGQVTDTHILLVDLTEVGMTGGEAEQLLVDVGLYCNKNCIPSDPGGPRNPSGIRLGSTVATNRGIGAADCEQLGLMIGELLRGKGCVDSVKAFVNDLCTRYPID